MVKHILLYVLKRLPQGWVLLYEWAAANLDVSKDFITVIPEDKITDMVFLESEIIKNRNYSVNNRKKFLSMQKNLNGQMWLSNTMFLQWKKS